MFYVCRKIGFQSSRVEFRFHSGIEHHHQSLELLITLQKYLLLDNPINDSQKFTFENRRIVSECEYFRMQNCKMTFGHRASGIANPQNHRFFSLLREYRNKENQRTISVNVFVRSIVSILQKQDQWDTLLSRLCAVSSSEITPPIAVQVLKRIKKPNLALKFFQWLEDHDGFNHDGLTYSAILKVLTKFSHPSRADIADGLLDKKIDLGFDVTSTDFDLVLQQWVRVGKSEKALGLLDEMKTRGFVPVLSSCNALLKGLFKSKQKNFGWELFYQMQDGWINALDTHTFNIVMKVACVEGRTEEASEFFSTMKQRDFVPDLDSFNILIKGFCVRGDTEMICSLFKQMLDQNVKPDSYTINLLIKELCKQGRPECGNDLFNYMRKVGWIDRKFVYTQLVDSLCNYGWWLKALKIFIKMIRRRHHPSIDLYRNLIRRLCSGGRIREAFKLKDLIASKGFITDVVNYSVLMEGVCLAGRMDMVNKLLREFQHKGLDPDLRTWNIVLRGHCMVKNVTEALELIEKIKGKGWEPDMEPCNNLISSLMIEGKVEEAMEVKNRIEIDQNINYDTYAIMINELSKLNDLDQATDLLTEMVIKDLRPDKLNYGVVIEGHCRLKNIKEACIILDEMVSRGCKPDDKTYTSLFVAFCTQGRISEALDLWEDVIEGGYQPDVSTLSSAVYKLWKDGNVNAECNMVHGKEIFEASI